MKDDDRLRLLIRTVCMAS